MASRRRRFTNPDLWFTDDGDLKIDHDGDLKDTLSNENRAVIQEIKTIVSSNKGEWALSPKVGADLSDLRGETSTESIAQKAVVKITQEILDNEILSADEFIVVPMVIEEYLIIRVIVESPIEDFSISFGYDSNTKSFIGY